MTPLDFVSRTPELSNVVCLQKPFRPNDLMHAIEAARDAVRPSVTGVGAAMHVFGWQVVVLVAQN